MNFFRIKNQEVVRHPRTDVINNTLSFGHPYIKRI